MIKIFNPHKSLNTPTSAALGTFDGLHTGHMTIINKLCGEGRFKKCVFTFSNSPAFVAANADVKYILSQREKYDLLEKSGVEYLAVKEFDREFMSLSASEFFDKYIIGILNAKEIFVGYNYTFGKNKEGTTDVLKELCLRSGIALNVIAPVYSDGEPVSSTRIRREISEGNLESAAALLGRHTAVFGAVEEGNKLGRRLGFPTANISVDDNRSLPPDGVYAARTYLNGKMYGCIANLGARPTVSDKGERLFEVHIAGFEGDLYGKELSIELIGKIRDIQKFGSVQQLKEQLETDKKTVNKICLEKTFDNR